MAIARRSLCVALVYLRLLLNLVNDHAARLIVRERLGVIAVARMHPDA